MLALLAAAAATAAAAPAVTTQAPRDVTREGATLVATVDPNGVQTSVRFELGRTTDYGLQSESRAVGAGTEPVEVAIPVGGLASGSTYHARAVATSTGGTARGADVTFRTQRAARVPTVSTVGARDVTHDAATLVARVNPGGAATRYRFEYGTSTRYGRSTPEADVGQGETAVTVTARVTGLAARRRHHFRVVAANSVGSARGNNRTFVTLRGLTGIQLQADPEPAVWGQTVRISGTVQGAAPSGVRLALERQEVPFTGVFGQVGPPVAAARKGTFAFRLPVYRTIRVRATTRTDLPLASAPVEIRVRPKVGLIPLRRGGRLRFSGTVSPELPEGVVSLQRRSATGRWATIARKPLQAGPAGRSHFVIRTRARTHSSTWRAVVRPNAGAAYLRGTSRIRVVPPASLR